MNLLVTAGNTQAPIDRVRCVTNVFSGRTGAQVPAAGLMAADTLEEVHAGPAGVGS